MKKLALIGKNISHSKSQKVYESILKEKVDYTLLDIPSPEEIPQLKKLFDMFDGISITSPYKSAFGHQVFIQDISVQQIGSINCLRKKGGRHEGVSTDFFALRDHFDHLKKKYNSFRVALLGDGNMSGITRFILDRMGMEYKIFSRRRGNLALDTSLEKVFSSDRQTVIVNSCSREFVFGGEVPSGSMFWDYNYDIDGHRKHMGTKCSYKDGYSLLQLQAKYALDFWYGR